MTGNLSERLAKRRETDAEKWAQIGVTPAWPEIEAAEMGRVKHAHLEGSASLEPIVLKMAEALEYYASKDVYVRPDHWRYSKEGGAPQLEDCEEVSEIGKDALTALANFLGGAEGCG
jgi:hypothetical protein